MIYCLCRKQHEYNIFQPQDKLPRLEIVMKIVWCIMCYLLHTAPHIYTYNVYMYLTIDKTSLCLRFFHILYNFFLCIKKNGRKLYKWIACCIQHTYLMDFNINFWMFLFIFFFFMLKCLFTSVCDIFVYVCVYVRKSLFYYNL